jgi:hypothetical protein
MLVALLFYGYATGIFSSRKLERNTYDSVAFRYIAANSHPDHDTIAAFRRRFLPELTKIFVWILEIAGQMKVLKLKDGKSGRHQSKGQRIQTQGVQLRPCLQTGRAAESRSRRTA